MTTPHKKGCGCVPCSGRRERDPNAGDYVMVAVTANKAPICEESIDADSDCIKLDIPYDQTVSDSSVPAFGSMANVSVCNGDLYAVGFWLFFPIIKAVLYVSAINGNVLSLQNTCSAFTAAAKGNPSPGTIIPKNSKFYLVDAPPCEGTSDSSDVVTAALLEMTELPIPNLRAAGVSEKVQLVGLVISDPNNADFKKVIVRAISFYDINGTISMPDTPQVAANATGYRELGYRLSDSGIVRFPDIATRVGASYNTAFPYYRRTIAGIPDDVNGRIWRGLDTPVELINAGYSNLVNNANPYTIAGIIVTTSVTPYTTTVNLSGNAAVVGDPALNPKGDTFTALLRITLCLRGNSSGNVTYPKLLIQNKEMAMVGTYFSSPTTFTIPVQVVNDANKALVFKITTDDTVAVKGAFKVDLLGIFE